MKSTDANPTCLTCKYKIGWHCYESPPTVIVINNIIETVYPRLKQHNPACGKYKDAK